MLFVLGAILLLLVLRDVFHSAVPRAMNTRFCIAPVLVSKILWPLFLLLTSRISSPVFKAEVLSFFAPFALVVLLFVWICLVAVSFGLFSLGLSIHYSSPVNSIWDALYISANSVLTLGPTEDFAPTTGTAKFLMLASHLLGMILIASVLSLMFGLISAIQPREKLVSIVSNLGGSPPSGIAILETYSRMGGRDSLHKLFDECHDWCADILETHRAFPILPYFRSNDSRTSWLTVLGAVLEAIALILSADPDKNYFSARMTFLIGSRLVREFFAFFQLPDREHDEIGDDEFHELYLRLHSAGYCSNSEEETRANFRSLRLEYFGAYRALCEYLAVPTPSSCENPQVIPSPAICGLKQSAQR